MPNFVSQIYIFYKNDSQNREWSNEVNQNFRESNMHLLLRMTHKILKIDVTDAIFCESKSLLL